ncbi:FixH protein [Dyadobacter koreensis]|uniref:FixH protein n=1 Tax=Dyadobacter koreensis TaxID=408657 RepID=A0A1H6RR13_9BACT|nr:FixH family protein [Dyadobacter koreensis]SEI58201.1 FixH protein [Dyadobacter koreensis]
MKLNWGAGIAILYSGFVAMILVLVGMSASQKIDLVTDNYYAEELQFQDKINKSERAKALEDPLKWEVDEKGILIHYPKSFSEKNLSGKVNLYCPSDDSKDLHFQVSTKNNIQFIASSEIPDGRYYLQIDWKNGEDTYWNEDLIVINKNPQ